MEMTPEMKALLERLNKVEAENAALKSKAPGSGGTVTFKSSTLVGGTDANGEPGKGTVSAYGLGRRPITAYANQWQRILEDSPKMGAYVIEHAANLGFKSDEQRDSTVAFFQAVAPLLEQIAALVPSEG